MNLTPVSDSTPLTPIPEIRMGGGGARTMSFPDAMKKIIDGMKVTRVEWGNTDYCFLKDEWLSIFTKGKVFVWKINDGDMFAQDWIVVTEPN